MITKDQVDQALDDYLNVVGSMPPVRQRTPEQFNLVNALDDAQRAISRAYREQQAQKYWARWEAGHVSC